MTQTTKSWAEQPIKTKFLPFIFCVLYLAASLIITAHKGMDNDSFYMIVQGRDILQNGFPEINNYTFYDNLEITVQQGPYCIAMYLIHEFLGNFGILLFAALQQLLLFLVIEKRLRYAINDKFWTYMCAALICILNTCYTHTLRPENITLILLTLDSLILEKYKSTNNPKYLYLLPLIILAEINLHASMWIFHFCMILANITPSICKSILPSDNIKMNKHISINIILMLLIMQLNPYHAKNIFYVFNSLDTFSWIDVSEQNETTIASTSGIFMLITIIYATIFISHKLAKSTTVYICLGFIFLSTTSYHSTMFLVIVMTYLVHDTLIILNNKTQHKTAELIPNITLVIIPVVFLILAGYFAGITYKQIKNFDVRVHMDPAVKYIKEHDINANVINNMNVGPYLLYHDINNIFMDSRPELLNKSINNNYNAIHDFYALTYGQSSDETLKRYKDLQDYLEKYDIKYVIISTGIGGFSYLKGYLDNTDEYQIVDLTDYKTPEIKTDKHILYERVDD